MNALIEVRVTPKGMDLTHRRESTSQRGKCIMMSGSFDFLPVFIEGRTMERCGTVCI